MKQSKVKQNKGKQVLNKRDRVERMKLIVEYKNRVKKFMGTPLRNWVPNTNVWFPLKPKALKAVPTKLSRTQRKAS